MATAKEIKIELTSISKLSKAQMVKALNKMVEEKKISGFGKFKDGINVYKKNSCEVIFEIAW